MLRSLLLLCLGAGCASSVPPRDPPTAHEIAAELARTPAFVAAVSASVAERVSDRILERVATTPVSLPPVSSGEDITTTLAVTITARGQLYADGRPVDLAGLGATAADATRGGHEARAVIAADAAVPHARVIEVIDLLKSAGIVRFALNVQAP